MKMPFLIAAEEDIKHSEDKTVVYPLAILLASSAALTSKK